MVIISHKHRFIIFKSYKTGSTTIENYFSSVLKRNLDPGEYISGKYKTEKGHIINKHITPEELFRLMPELKGYYKICPIRNPFTQIVSCFIHNNGKIPNERELSGYIMKCEYNPSSFSNIKKQHKHLRTYYSYATNKKKECIDFFIKLENLDDDIFKILDKFNITNYNPKRIGNSRQSKLKYQIDDIYSQKNINLVYDIFKEEINLGNYSFPIEKEKLLSDEVPTKEPIKTDSKKSSETDSKKVPEGKSKKSSETDSKKVPDGKPKKSSETDSKKPPETDSKKVPEGKSKKPPETDSKKVPEGKSRKPPETDSKKVPEGKSKKPPETDSKKVPEGKFKKSPIKKKKKKNLGKKKKK
jgi:hypothetical protein